MACGWMDRWISLGEEVGWEFVEEWQPTGAPRWGRDLEKAIPTRSDRACERGLCAS